MYNCLFYGSLRKGEYNHSYFNKGEFEFLQTVKLKGYKLYSLGSYPGIKESNSLEDTVVCDVVIINNSLVMNGIDRMELGAGYSRKIVDVTLESGKILSCVIYIYEGRVKEESLVAHGDWSKFLKQQKENICVE